MRFVQPDYLTVQCLNVVRIIKIFRQHSSISFSRLLNNTFGKC